MVDNHIGAIVEAQIREDGRCGELDGCQFTSDDDQKFLSKNLLECSMSAVGHCGDIERFHDPWMQRRVAAQDQKLLALSKLSDTGVEPNTSAD